MFVIQSYPLAVVFCVITMLCWGSWANTQKLAGKRWRFELFYWDYVLGVMAMSLFFALTLGSLGDQGRSFQADLSQAEFGNLAWAFFGGVIFNAANILLVAAIAIAGMSVAFPVGIGLALVVGVLVNYFRPIGKGRTCPAVPGSGSDHRRHHPQCPGLPAVTRSEHGRRPERSDPGCGLRPSDGQFLPLRRRCHVQGFHQHGAWETQPLHGHGLFRSGRLAEQLHIQHGHHAQTLHRHAHPDDRILPGPAFGSPLGRGRGHDLGCGYDVQYHRLRKGRFRHLLWVGPGSDSGGRLLGSVHLEGIPRGSAHGQAPSLVDVPKLHCRAGILICAGAG